MSGGFLSKAGDLCHQLNSVIQDQLALVAAKHSEISELNKEVVALRSEKEQLKQDIVNLKKLSGSFATTAEAAQRREVRLRKSNSVSLGTMGGIEDIRVTGLRHMDSIYDINPDELKKQRMSRVIDDSARHHYSISPELEAKTQEVIHNKYGGRDKAEKAARVIQECYRQYRLQQSFHKLRQAKRRRLTLDSLNSPTDGESVKKCDMAVSPTAESPSAAVVATPSSLSSSSSSSSSTTVVTKGVTIDVTNRTTKPNSNDTGTIMVEKNSSDSNDLEVINQRLSTVSIASKTDSQRGSYVESDESDDNERENHAPEQDLKHSQSTRKRADSIQDQNRNSIDHSEPSLRHHRHSWVSQSVGSTSDVFRKRMYRIGLNLFNTKPEKGLTFLIRQGFVEDSPNVISNFLVSRKGISRQVIGEFLGNGTEKSKKILKAVCNQIDLSKLDIDEALRKFQSHIRIQGEAQRVERLVEAFAQRYLEANADRARKLENPDSIFVLAFAIIMLNTDAHSPSMRKEKRMTEEDFINNLRGIDNGKDMDAKMLANVYNRVKNKEFKASDDHINQVLVIEQRIIGKKPVLALPYRRLVCYCRMYQVTDVSRPQRPGLHMREVFLFNDLLLITKLSARRRNQYTYRLSAQLTSLEVESFTNENYPHGIKILQGGKMLVLFSLPNQDDCKNFVQDIAESILEVKHMESLRIEESLESMEEQKESQKSPLTSSRKLSSSLHNLSLTREQMQKNNESSTGSSCSSSNSRGQKTRSLQSLPLTPEKPSVLNLSAANPDRSSTSDQPQSPISIFSIFTKSSRKNSSTNVDKIKEEDVH